MIRLEKPGFFGVATPNGVRRDRRRLIGLLMLAALFAYLGRSFSIDSARLRPAFATIHSLRQALVGIVDERLILERRFELERGRRVIETQKLAAADSELAALRREFRLDAPDTRAWRLVRVLGVIPSRSQREFLLDQGSKIDIRVGAAVTATTDWGLAFAGRVVEVGESTAKVLALTDPSSSLPVSVEGQGSGLLFQGGFPQYFGRLLYLPDLSDPPHYAEVRLDEISSAQGSLVGWIWKEDAGKTPGGTGLFSSTRVLPTVDPAKLHYVWVEVL